MKKEMHNVKSVLQGHHSASASSQQLLHTDKDDKKLNKKRNLLEVFKKSPNHKDPAAASKNRHDKHIQNIDNVDELEYYEYFQQLKIPDECIRDLKHYVFLMYKVICMFTTTNIDEISDNVQMMYHRVENFIETKYSMFPYGLKEQVLDTFEKVIMSKTHKYVFYL